MIKSPEEFGMLMWTLYWIFFFVGLAYVIFLEIKRKFGG